VGFSTYTGTVTAASSWGGPAERMRVRPAMDGSYEAIFHGVGLQAFLVCPLPDARCAPALGQPRLERAIGVIYRPQTERQSHWFATDITSQFDAVVHIDVTRAVEPLERGRRWSLDEPPETYPSAL